MKAVAIEAFGGPEGLVVVDLPEPVPAAGQVLVTVEAIGVGGADALIRSGALAAYGFTAGHVPGGEVAGIVTGVGAEVDAAWIGRRVWAFTGAGGYAEQVAVPVGAVVPLPANLSVVDAVTLGGSGVVAHFGLRHARFAPGDAVLIRGAAGGIGTMAVQLAARGGAGAVAVTTSSPRRGDRLRELGATRVLDRRGDGGPGYDVIIDVVAGADLPSFFDRLNPGGRIVSVGAVAGDPPPDFGMALFAAFQKSLSYATFSADLVSDADRRAVVTELFAGDVRPVVHGVLPLDDAVTAHRELASGAVFGRLVLTTSAGNL